jgi:uncharacterized protein (DUF1684 family)
MNDFNEWIETRNKQWRNPTGFLAVTGMHWLSETPQTFTDVSGEWWAIGHTAYAVGFEGNPAEQSWTIDHDSEKMVEMVGGVVEIASRGGNLALRPRHTNSKMFELFEGVITYDYNPEFKVIATLERDERTVPIDSVIGDIGMSMQAVGTLHFKLNGVDAQLTAFHRANPELLSIIFRDGTSGKETYGTGRNVTATHLVGDTWEIDFNKSGNYPCAYTDFATCPVAPSENHLKVEICAGEKTPKIKSTADGVVTH